MPAPFRVDVFMTQSSIVGHASVNAKGAALVAQYFWTLAAVLLAFRLFLNSRCNLVPDEAFYWTWTRHLATGYFDHPPMVAWLMWLSTRLLGNTESAVRLPAAMMTVGALAVLYRLAKYLLRDERAVGFVMLMWIAGPLLAVMGTIHTPDSSAIFFSVCALACAAMLFERDDRRDPSETSRRSDGAGLWLLFGLFCGLGLLAKYTTILVPAGVGLALITSRRAWHHLRRPWVYLSAIVAAAVFSPCVYWNATHDWASFLFQLHHGAGGGITEGKTGFISILVARLLGLALFIGGQAVVWTPVLFAIVLLLVAGNWIAVIRSAWASLRGRELGNQTTWFERMGKLNDVSGVDRLLLWTGTMPLLLFGWAATRSHGEINWPAFAYFPLSLLMGRYLTENWQGYRVQWARIGITVAIGFTIVVHLMAVPKVQQSVGRHIKLTHQVTDLWGWREFGRQLALHAEGVPVICNRHQDAGEAAFYMPGQPEVWCESKSGGSRVTAFDYFDVGRPDYPHLPQVLYVGDRVEAFMRNFGYWRKAEIIMIENLAVSRTRSHRAVRVER